MISQTLKFTVVHDILPLAGSLSISSVLSKCNVSQFLEG